MTDPGKTMSRLAIFRLELFKLSETFIYRQADHLKRYDPIFIGSATNATSPKFPSIYPPKAKSKLVHLLNTFTSSYIKRELAIAPPALVHAHFAIDGAIACTVAKHLRVPLVVTLHGYDVTATDGTLLRSKNLSQIASVLRRNSLARYASRFVCVSEFIRKAAISKGFPAEKLITIPVGIEFAPPSSQSRSKNTILHIGRLVEKKGTSQLIKAMSLVQKRLPDCELVIAGDGPLLSSLQSQAAALGLADNVVFLGAVEHAHAINLLERATVLAVPSITATNGDSEGLPTVIFEAAASETPVVASDTSGIPEAITDGQTGILVAEHDISGLSNALIRVLCDPDLARTLGRNLRVASIEKYAIERQTSKLEDLFDEVLSEWNAR